jgi:hypothetical protein
LQLEISETTPTISTIMGSLGHSVPESAQSVPEESKDSVDSVEHIPLLFLPSEEGGNKLILYFHGNAEDIGLAFDLLYALGQEMQMHVIAVEYPGYGLYK